MHIRFWHDHMKEVFDANKEVYNLIISPIFRKDIFNISRRTVILFRNVEHFGNQFCKVELRFLDRSITWTTSYSYWIKWLHRGSEIARNYAEFLMISSWSDSWNFDYRFWMQNQLHNVQHRGIECAIPKSQSILCNKWKLLEK